MGGGFGICGGCYLEYGLLFWVVEVVGCFVKWIVERLEGMMIDE